MPPQQEPPKPAFQPKNVVEIPLIGASLHSWCFLLILRWRMGVDQPGWMGVGSLLMLALFAEYYHSYLMYQYLKIWLLALVIQRLFRDKLQHSLYLGYPWIAALIPPICWIADPDRREAFARWVEPLICLVVGAVVARWDRNFGRFISWGAYSLLIVQVIHRMLDARIRIEVNNAMAEAEKYG
jgi:hypothetical protein